MMIALSFAMSASSVRTWCFWLGSRPSVGSSRIRTSGSCSSASASPTRRLKPLDRVSIGCCRTASSSRRAVTLSSRVCFSSAGKRRSVGDEVEQRRGRHVAIGGRALGQIADPPADLDRVLREVDAADLDAAGVGRQIAGDHPHRGRLAGAVGAEKAQDLAARDVEGDAVDRGDRAEALDQPFDREQLIHGRRFPSSLRAASRCRTHCRAPHMAQAGRRCNLTIVNVASAAAPTDGCGACAGPPPGAGRADGRAAGPRESAAGDAGKQAPDVRRAGRPVRNRRRQRAHPQRVSGARGRRSANGPDRARPRPEPQRSGGATRPAQGLVRSSSTSPSGATICTLTGPP